ncbi:glycoside hydrolase family 43 protein [Aspergillus aculeatus ATCC 16872]|uniref:Glycoside hydrolase family 43 protein n=1 Tax=Aspergillus aculeatus (strain ATCC 16872 / CBS 172.66 / WB 5094) TaxID=690307 RepID=A0A1L9WNL2_ASPA1|nr:glycoside hydrolase family 43 protein [Aspergillus aculeatus ATCC 16872]OJJ97720.1 glycoside hydrolase family 43 protein [Aspergillus aculeatus ATCC 16872]
MRLIQGGRWPLGLLLAATAPVLGSPVAPRSAGPWLAIDSDFPDPGFVQGDDGAWYAFGTNGNGRTVQVATSPDFESWTLLDKEAMPTLAGWETAVDHWAPDVVQRNDGKFVLYYSGEAKDDLRHHCVGVAVSVTTDPTGPYIPNPTPLSCRLDQGGSIDPSGFLDRDGSRYVVFKVDGNSIGNGGDCNNGIAPLKSTPILLQKVADDGFTPVGDAVQILDRDDSDGPLVEAPNLILHGDTYFLFYSTHCYTDPKYDVRWATSKSITGPYTKSGRQLFASGQWNLTSPGGGTVCGCGDRMLFHGFCGGDRRCTYAARLDIQGEDVVVL